MKHDIKITLILLAMFFITQMIGLLVIDTYSSRTVQIKEGDLIINKTIGGNVSIPYGMEPPAEMKLKPANSFTSILISFVIAMTIFLLLIKFRAKFFIKAWFILVVFITISIALTALISRFFPSLQAIIAMEDSFLISKASLFALILAIPLTFYKIIKRNLIVHNITELLIYPGLAAIFVPILNIFWVFVLLILISLYDIYAVWHSKIMVNMAKYQINNLKVFTGFFLPYLSKEAWKQIKNAKFKSKSKTKLKTKMKNVKVSLAILGGGDVAFPLIFAGVVMRMSSFLSAFIVAVAVTFSLLFLFTVAKKQKFYPAMPFLSAGCIIGYLLSLLV